MSKFFKILITIWIVLILTVVYLIFSFGIWNLFFMSIGTGFIYPLAQCNDFISKDIFIEKYNRPNSELREFIQDIKSTGNFVALRSSYLDNCNGRDKGILFVHTGGMYDYVYFLYKYGKDIDGIPYAFYAFKDSITKSAESPDLVNIDSLK